MASTSRSGAGGKIVTNRRKQRLSGTPYDRPQPPPPPQLKSPNWFSGVVVPSARAFAAGAGKFLYSVFTESESSSEDEDYDSEEAVENVFPDGVNAVNEKKVVSSELMQHGEGSYVKWTGSKRIIEKLILQETFTREECDSMMKVLNSRVVDRLKESAENSLRVGSPGKNFEDVDMYNKVAQEAKKWFKDKKGGSTSVTELTPGTSKRHVQSGEASPVDVARSYMKERPRWTSPTQVDDRTPLSSKLFKDGASYSISYDSFSSSKKRSGSWNFQEELQRVRAKATEDMLRTPSKKLDPLFFAPTSSGEGRLGAGRLFLSGQKSNYSESVNTTGQVDVLVNARVSSNPVLAAFESRQDSMTNEALPSHVDTTVTKNNQDSEVVCADDDLLCSKDTSVQNHDVENRIDPNPITEFLGRESANGVSSFQPRAELGQNHEQQQNEENHVTASVTEKNPVINTTNNILANSEIPSKTYPEVPILTETESLVSDPKNDLQVQNEGLSTKEDAEIAMDKKPSKPSRRGRGRGLSKG